MDQLNRSPSRGKRTKVSGQKSADGDAVVIDAVLLIGASIGELGHTQPAAMKFTKYEITLLQSLRVLL